MKARIAIPVSFVIPPLAVALVVAACGDFPETQIIVRPAPDASQSDVTAEVAQTDVGDAGDGGRDPDANCVKPGTPDNELGLGAYCEKGEDCAWDGAFRICTADFGAPANAWFCTTLCSKDEDCGSGMFCSHDPKGTACVPLVCAADAGADGG